MSYCITCTEFIRRKQGCKKNNPIIISPIIADCESLFKDCSDYILDKEHFFVRD